MSVLHLTELDVQYCANKNTNGGLLNQFNENLGDHEMTVLHDEGVYRHLRFKNPKNGFYWFDLVTWPGNLTISGDIGTYTFAREPDMFTFMVGHINTGYWAQKLQHGSSGGRATVKNHDEEEFKSWLVQDFWEYSRDMDTTTALAWWLELKDDILGKYACADTHSTEGALSTLQNLDLPHRLKDHYSDAWEAAQGWEQYDWHFELCLAAIVAGIRAYTTHQAAQLTTTENEATK